MASNVTELIIKVGKKSTLSFSHSTAYRVVTYDELVETSKYLPECNLLIIEGIFDGEYENIRDFVTEYLKNSNNKVWFYTDDANDENINGLVDELDCDIFMTKESLFRNIFDVTKLNISTDINLRKELSESIQVEDGYGIFDGNFGIPDTEVLEEVDIPEIPETTEIPEPTETTEVHIPEIEETDVPVVAKKEDIEIIVHDIPDTAITFKGHSHKSKIVLKKKRKYLFQHYQTIQQVHMNLDPFRVS